MSEEKSLKDYEELLDRLEFKKKLYSRRLEVLDRKIPKLKRIIEEEKAKEQNG